MHLGLPGEQLGEDAAETQRVLAECRAQPVVARGGEVPLVEHEVDDLQHRRQPLGALVALGNLERNARLGEGPLRADDPLGDGRRGHEERPRDLLGRQTSEQAQRERHTCLGREDRDGTR